MDPLLLKLFLHQIWTQCMFALEAYSELQIRLSELARATDEASDKYVGLVTLSPEELNARAMEIALGPSVRAWQPIQAFLTAVANISKALWGQAGKSAARRAPLRETLHVADTSPLRPTSMRNHFDHFDERLEAWWEVSRDHNYVDLSFGDPGSSIAGVAEEEMFRSYDPATGDLIFWGHRYNLPAIVAEIERISPLALKEAVKQG